MQSPCCSPGPSIPGAHTQHTHGLIQAQPTPASTGTGSLPRWTSMCSVSWRAISSPRASLNSVSTILFSPSFVFLISCESDKKVEPDMSSKDPPGMQESYVSLETHLQSQCLLGLQWRATHHPPNVPGCCWFPGSQAALCRSYTNSSYF